MNKTKLKEVLKEIIKEESEKYQKFFKKTMKKFGVSSPDEFESKEKEKEFWNYIDKNWDSDNETD